MELLRITRISGLILLLLLFCCISPVLAGEKYSSGQPVISTAIIGSNELRIGEKIDLAISITNSGTVNMKFVDEGTITPDYLPTTALSLTADLNSGDSPVQVTTDSQILGDIKAGTVTQTTFEITVPESAKSGSYQIPLTISYQYMSQATQTGIDEIQYAFKDDEKTFYLPVTVCPAVTLQIISVDTGDLNVGGEGHITVTVKNIGSDIGKETVFTIEPVGNSPIVPIQNSIYVGAFPKGESTTISFKVSVASDADAAIQYPLKLFATYTDYQGLAAETSQKDISAGFNQKITFEVVSTPQTVSSGGKEVINVEYRNTGLNPVYNAQAGINIVDPFTSEDDQSYLGTIKPGEIATARFKLNVNSDTTSKDYALDSEIRYTDINLTEFVSDPIKVPVIVTESSGDFTIVAGVIILILIGGGIYYYRRIKQP